MYSNLTLYYLNQMGITPWISKDSPLYSANEPKVISSVQLLVLTNGLLNLKEQSLLRNIISWLGLSANNWVHLQIKTDATKPEMAADLSEFESDNYLSFGLPHDFFTEFRSAKPVVQVDPLSLLLNNAFTKKKLFNCLVTLKTHLSK